MVTLELTFTEAEAVKSWLLEPAADGSAAIDDEDAKSVMVKLGALLDYIEGVSRVRDELEQAGFVSDSPSDEQVAARPGNHRGPGVWVDPSASASQEGESIFPGPQRG